MVATATRTPDTSLAEIVLTRVYEAPREQVFRAWTEAELLSRWFGPPDVEMPACTLEARVGGQIRFCHRMADGMELWVQGTFDEVQAPERLRFTATFVDVHGRPAAPPVVPDWPVGTVLVTSVTLAVHPRGTHLTMRQTISPAAAATLEAVRRERTQASQGWLQTLDRLGELLGAIDAKMPSRT